MNWLSELPSVRVLDCADAAVPDAVCQSTEPVLLRGLVAGWPAVAHGRSEEAIIRYLARYATAAPLTIYVGDASIDGNFFYNDDCTAFNFRRTKATLGQVLARLQDPSREDAWTTIYASSTPVDQWLPGFRAENDLRWSVADALVNFWLGNQTCISAHYDFPSNIGCVVAGRRRFTLLPPEQIDNLYVGPVDRAPGGQPISLVDFRSPDFARHPRFKQALRHAKTALLGPGDAIYVPSMWWHHVESLAAFNLFVNYWWSDPPSYLSAPSHALLHAMLALRDLPAHQKEAWRKLYEHYVFDADESVFAHIPERGRGYLAPFTEQNAKRLCAELLKGLISRRQEGQ